LKIYEIKAATIRYKSGLNAPHRAYNHHLYIDEGSYH